MNNNNTDIMIALEKMKNGSLAEAKDYLGFHTPLFVASGSMDGIIAVVTCIFNS